MIDQGRPLGRSTGRTRACEVGPGRVRGHRGGERRARPLQGWRAQWNREARLPLLAWPRELPIGGEPADVSEIVERYAEWLSRSAIPKLFISAEPGAILAGRAREFCGSWPNQREVSVKGTHFVQEDSPAEIGTAVAEFLTALRG
jgi:pimeloyl-ACP methyl ester carboxylesterase